MRKEVWIQDIAPWIYYAWTWIRVDSVFFLVTSSQRGSKKTRLNQIQPLSTSPSFLHGPRVPAGVTYRGQFLNIFLRSPEWSQTEVLQQIINKLLPEHNSATRGGETNDLGVKLSPVKTGRTCGWPASGRDPAAHGRSHWGERRGEKRFNLGHIWSKLKKQQQQPCTDILTKYRLCD